LPGNLKKTANQHWLFFLFFLDQKEQKKAATGEKGNQ